MGQRFGPKHTVMQSILIYHGTNPNSSCTYVESPDAAKLGGRKKALQGVCIPVHNAADNS